MAQEKAVVFSSLNVAEVFLVRSLLTREGIESELRRTFLAPLAGEIPMDDARVELLVATPALAGALAVIQKAQDTHGPDKVCPHCSESSPPAFELCWACGKDLEGEHDID